MSIHHELFGKKFPSQLGIVPLTAKPELLGKIFPPNTGLVPMTAGRLPAYACGRGRT
jgi:hypothetical protein